LGFIWLIFWLIFYEAPTRHNRINKAEFNYIHSDSIEITPGTDRRLSWGRILGIRQTWAFIAGKFFTDPVWWFYLFWIPSYFNSRYNIDLKSSWVYVSTIYFVATFGSVFGGYLSGWFIKQGWPVYRARKTAMFMYALCVLPIFFIQYTRNAWAGVALVSLAAAAHQAWSANIFTTASDMFPKKAISSVVGLGTMAGAVGSILFPIAIGATLDHFKLLGKITAGYNIIFVICSCAYVLAWLVMHLLSPQMKTVEIIE
jgi:ACS family hexuronate transporter-like MFS transporter